MRISDWSSDVCSSDLLGPELGVDRLAQTGHDEDRPSHVRARVLLPSGAPIDALQGRIDAGWAFSRTNLTEQFGYDQFRVQLPEGAEPVPVRAHDKIGRAHVCPPVPTAELDSRP